MTYLARHEQIELTNFIQSIRISQFMFQTRLARIHNRTDVLRGNENGPYSERSWGNASQEMLSGGLETDQRLRFEESTWFLECEELVLPSPPRDMHRDTIAYCLRPIKVDV